MISVPSKNEWTTRIPAGGKQIDIEHHTVFGWKVQRHLMPEGAVLVTNSTAEVPRNRAPNRAMYVSGRCTVENDGVALDDRLPGLFTGERPAHPAGLSRVTAVEPTEFWCFNYSMNRKALPVLTPVRVAAGSMLQITTGQLLFVMKGRAGSLVGPMTLRVEQDMQIEVEEDLFAFLIANEKT